MTKKRLSTSTRKSSRNSLKNSLLQLPDAKHFLSKIRSSDKEIVILKPKNFVSTEVAVKILPEMISALKDNNGCQVLYFQGLGIDDDRLISLVKVLKLKSQIWALNIGENDNITVNGWNHFIRELPNTNITHMYASEKAITPQQKLNILEIIRRNRRKHSLHFSESNIKVIKKVTNMWWNPGNSSKLLSNRSTCNIDIDCATVSSFSSSLRRKLLLTDDFIMHYLMKEVYERVLEHGLNSMDWQKYYDLHSKCGPLLLTVETLLEKSTCSVDERTSTFSQILSEQIHSYNDSDKSSIYFYIYFDTILRSILQAVEQSLRCDAHDCQSYPTALVSTIEEMTSPLKLSAVTLDKFGSLQYFMKEVYERVLEHGLSSKDWQTYYDLHSKCGPLLLTVETLLEKSTCSVDERTSTFSQILSEQIHSYNDSDKSSIYFYIYFDTILRSILQAVEQSLRCDAHVYQSCPTVKIIAETLRTRLLATSTQSAVHDPIQLFNKASPSPKEPTKTMASATSSLQQHHHAQTFIDMNIVKRSPEIINPLVHDRVDQLVREKEAPEVVEDTRMKSMSEDEAEEMNDNSFDPTALIAARYAPLSTEEAERVASVLRVPEGNDEVRPMKFDIPIINSTILRLRPGIWLNDQIVNFCMSMLQERDKELVSRNPNRAPSFFFHSYFISKLLDEGGYKYANVKRWSTKFKIDIFELSKVFFPVNISNNHWTMAMIDMKKKQVCYYDSFHAKGDKYLNGLMNYVVDEGLAKHNTVVDRSEWTFISANSSSPMQTNGCDCGVFSIMCADFLSDDLPLSYHKSEMNTFRSKICADILRGSFTYPFN